MDMREYGFDVPLRRNSRVVTIGRRDGWFCSYCKTAINSFDATTDHVIPRSKGGGHANTNRVLCCSACNGAKGNMDEAVFRASPWLAQHRAQLGYPVGNPGQQEEKVVATMPSEEELPIETFLTWGGELRRDWPPIGGAIIQCKSCGMRHGQRYMCATRWVHVDRAERQMRG